VRVAIIGAGGIAWRHLAVLAAEPDVEIAAHLARSPESAQRSAARWGGRAYTDLAAMLARDSIEAAWITVPPDAHGELELALIEREIPIFVEKPLSADRSTAERIAEAVGERGLVTAVGYQWRAMDTIPRLREVLAGRPPRMVLGAWHGTLPEPSWWRRRARSGGQMVEQATHLFDLARLLVGEARVVAAGAGAFERGDAEGCDVASVSSASLLYDSGALGSFTATSLLGRTAEVGLRLICEGLQVEVNREGVVYDDGRERREVRLASDPFVSIDRAFLRAARAGEPGLVHSSYQDALLTHRTVFDVHDMAAAVSPARSGTT
jgi:myo-inositol 2-dehydrogenase/D-chiro-inositol 1-dehydrogenase